MQLPFQLKICSHTYQRIMVESKLSSPRTALNSLITNMFCNHWNEPKSKWYQWTFTTTTTKYISVFFNKMKSSHDFSWISKNVFLNQNGPLSAMRWIIFFGNLELYYNCHICRYQNNRLRYRTWRKECRRREE